MGWLDRVAGVDYEVDETLTIPAGTPIYVNAIGMHYNPQHFPDPLKFDPDRFLKENDNDIKSLTYIPFGEGPRMCIGKFQLTLKGMDGNGPRAFGGGCDT